MMSDVGDANLSVVIAHIVKEVQASNLHWQLKRAAQVS